MEPKGNGQVFVDVLQASFLHEARVLECQVVPKPFALEVAVCGQFAHSFWVVPLSPFATIPPKAKH